MPKKDLPKRAKPETLVKTSRKGQIELSEDDLKRVSGGQKANTIKIE